MRPIKRAPIYLAFLVCACLGGMGAGFFNDSVRNALAQGFPFLSPFTGQQSESTTEFTNPKISFQQVGGVFSASTVPIGSVAYGSFGNATTYVSGTLYTASVYIPADMTVTNINFLNAGTVGTNAVIGALYNSAGVRIGTSALAGTATAGANAFQALALTAPVAIQGPGRYFIVIQANGATDNMRTVAASTFINVLTTAGTGVFATLPNITPPPSFAANIGPIAYLN